LKRSIVPREDVPKLEAEERAREAVLQLWRDYKGTIKRKEVRSIENGGKRGICRGKESLSIRTRKKGDGLMD